MHHSYFLFPWFGPLELHFAIAVILSVVIGYVVGAERELRGKDAGVSTHIMVILGATLFTVVSALDPTSPSRNRGAGRDRHRLPRRRPHLPCRRRRPEPYDGGEPVGRSSHRRHAGLWALWHSDRRRHRTALIPRIPPHTQDGGALEAQGKGGVQECTEAPAGRLRAILQPYATHEHEAATPRKSHTTPKDFFSGWALSSPCTAR